jgi:deazaflavin-dependent oxidoreductase (nitroreductase family)
MATPPPVPPAGSLGARLWNMFTKVHVAVFRATGGRIGSSSGGNGPTLLLNHVGAKSGKRRTTPLLYLADGDDVVLVASRGGSKKNPGWYHNLVANPETTVELRGEKRAVVAREATPEERRRVWPMVIEMYSDYDVYQSRTERKIPVLILAPAEERERPPAAA